MGRINIEDSLFKDSRWIKLIIKTGCEYKALGLVTKAWILAQEHWLEYKAVPKIAWPKDLDILIDVELACKDEHENVYVKGSKNAFLWLEQRSNSGKKISQNKLKQLENARLKKKELMLNIESVNKYEYEKTLKISERSLNGTERNEYGSEAPPPPLSHTHILNSIKQPQRNNFSEVIETKQIYDYKQNQITAAESFNKTFNEEFQKINAFIASNKKLKSLRFGVNKIYERFETLENFMAFCDEIQDTIEKKETENINDKLKYLIVSIKRETGMLK